MKLDYRAEALHTKVRVSHGEPCHWLSSRKLSISVMHTSCNCSSIISPVLLIEKEKGSDFFIYPLHCEYFLMFQTYASIKTLNC